MTSARGVWLLLYFSHQNVSMLDGGFQEWKRGGHPIEIKSNPLSYSKFTGRVNTKILATAGQIVHLLGNKNLVLIDVRSDAEFNGTDVRAARRGTYPFRSKHKLGQ
ncbi:MAG TPA: hypothetical protein VJ772_00995 [Nitrososphaeraceae archaeon]|nr:hypothetical protein [Nitrososphaeraceae archaeon]